MAKYSTPEEAYQAALELIEEAKKNEETELSLNNFGLETLPPEIIQLSNLFWLDLMSNQITEIPKHITQLSNLSSLDLMDNQITEIPQHITQLSNLTELDLSGNRISEIPQYIAQLSNLSSLDLSFNQITEIPQHITQLSNLTKLDLSSNRISEIPQYIAQLSNLTELDLSGNRISEIPQHITQLSNLTELDLSSNQISEIPQHITQLSNLTELDLRENPDLPIPPEILQDPENPQTILDYIASLQVPAEEARRLNEAKVIVVGQGSVGKTSLVNRLVHGTYHKDEEKTPGVSITDWVVKDGEDEIEVHLWDFGGQEIMHATHQFFLTRRSLYLLVLDCRQSEEENRLDYWLEIIRTFGEASPVIVVGNKVDQHPLELDITGLKNKYPNIVEILPTSAREGTNLDALRELVETQIPLLENVKDELPGAWFNIKETLEEMTAPHIAYEDYQQMCREEGLENKETQENLLQFLHDLGVVFSFPEEGSVSLGHTRVLNPNWVTRGVYQILNDAELNREKGGIFGWPDLRRVLAAPDYPEEMHRAFIMDLMQKFERAFSYRHGRWERFLVPDLLSKNEVDTGSWDDSLRFEYHYQIYYPSIISRIMVRHSDEIIRNLTWRTGAVFRIDGNETLVRADRGAAKLQIAVRGEPLTRRDFLAVLRNDIDRINTSLNIPVKQYIPVPGHPDILADYEHVKNLAKMGKEHYVPPGLMEDIPIKDLLGAYRSEKDRQAEAEAQRDKALDEKFDKIGKTLEEIKEAGKKTEDGGDTEKRAPSAKWVWPFIALLIVVVGTPILYFLFNVPLNYLLYGSIPLAIIFGTFLLTRLGDMTGRDAANVFRAWLTRDKPEDEPTENPES